MQFLLERLDRAPLYAGGPCRPFDLKAAVAAQVARIVSARPPERAAAMAAPQFGMPSVVELGQGDRNMLEAYAARLTRMLLQYEPRLRNPSVRIEAGADPMAPFVLVVRGALGPEQLAQEYTFPLGRSAGRA